jgi:hypothetical protein
MERQWTLSGALKTIENCKGVELNGKKIITKEGLQGLKACSALSYLTKVWNYRYANLKV